MERNNSLNIKFAWKIIFKGFLPILSYKLLFKSMLKWVVSGTFCLLRKLIYLFILTNVFNDCTRGKTVSKRETLILLDSVDFLCAVTLCSKAIGNKAKAPVGKRRNESCSFAFCLEFLCLFYLLLFLTYHKLYRK